MDTTPNHQWEEMPLGEVLLRLQGAIQNLVEALTVGGLPELIRERRIELSMLISEIKTVFPKLTDKSYASQFLMNTIRQAIKHADVILSRASRYLSEQMMAI